jgi:hypothetical protein
VFGTVVVGHLYCESRAAWASANEGGVEWGCNGSEVHHVVLSMVRQEGGEGS